MSMTVGEVNAYLRLIDQGFSSGINKAQGDLRRTGSEATSAGNKIKSGFSGAGKAAVAMGALGAAGIGALAVKTLKAGVAYNSLEQNSRASLKTMLGSSKAAQKQMESLNGFVSNSPFGKDTFIQSQQQMLAFGYKAKDIIPTFSAVQDAVAAAGGSSQQLSEITYVMAQIKSAGKITGQDLMQFGQRGIDAAEMIGQGMGKTAKQVREDITKGAISADQALSKLTQGMAERYKGAADGVKENWGGVKQALGAQMRNIGSELTKAFVNPVKGGLFVDWGNKAIGILKSFKNKLPSIVAVLHGKFGGALDRVGQFLDKLKNGIDGLSAARLGELVDKFRSMAPAAAPLTAMLAGLAGMKLPFIGGLNPLVMGLTAAAAASPELRAATADLSKELQGLSSTALPLVTAGLKMASQVITPLVTAFNSLPGPIKQAALAGGLMWLTWGKIPGVLKSVAMSAKTAVAGFVSLRAAALSSSAAVGVTNGLTAFSGAAAGAGAKGVTASKGISATGAAAAGAAGGMAGWAKATALAVGKVAAVPAALVAGGLAFSKWMTDIRDGVEGTGQFVDALKTSGGVMDSNVRSTVQAAIANTQLASVAKQAGLSQDQLVQAVTQGGPALDSLQAKIRELSAAQQSSISTGTSAGNVKTAEGHATAQLAGQLTNLRNEYGMAKDATHDLRIANEAIKEQLLGGLPQAQNQFRLSLQQTKEQLSQSGTALRGNSAAALANRNSILSMAQASMQQYQSMLQVPQLAHQAGVAYRSQIASIAGLIPQGRAGAQAMRQLATQMGMTPSAVRSMVKLDGYEDTMAKIRRLDAQLKRKMDARAKVDVSTEAGQKKAKSLDSDIKKIKGKKVKLEAEASRLQGPAEKAKKLLENLEKQRTAKMAVNDQATPVLTSIKALRDSITDKTVTFTTEHKTVKSGDRAIGGPVQRGKTYQVNERGPELFQSRKTAMLIPGGRQFWTAPESGRIIPASSTKRLLAGTVSGPGTSTSDSIIARISNKEELISADNAARNRGALDHIQAGGVIPGFAKGKKSSKASTAKQRAAAAKQKRQEQARNRKELAKNLGSTMFNLPGWREASAAMNVASQVQQLKDSFVSAGGKGWAKIANLQNFKFQGKKTNFGSLANLQKANKERLDAARQNLDQLKSEKVSTATNLRQSGMGDITSLQNTSGLGIKNWLKKQVEKVKNYRGNLEALAKRGLPQDLLNMLISAGINGADAAMGLMKLTGADWNDVVSSGKALATESTNLANVGSGLMHDAGIKSAQGLVDGLASQQKAIENQMIQIAKGMEKAIKKALKIKSPSRLFELIARFVPAGMRKGLLAGAPSVDKATVQMMSPALATAKQLASQVPLSTAGGLMASSPTFTTPSIQPSRQSITVNLTVVDTDGTLIGRMKTEANDVFGELADRYLYA